jgi:hypothetical protein
MTVGGMSWAASGDCGCPLKPKTIDQLIDKTTQHPVSDETINSLLEAKPVCIAPIFVMEVSSSKYLVVCLAIRLLRLFAIPCLHLRQVWILCLWSVVRCG